MVWFIALALLGTLFTGPHPYQTELFAVDQGGAGLWSLEALQSQRILTLKKATFRDWQEGDLVRVTTAGNFVRAVPDETATEKRQQEMERLLSRVLQASAEATGLRVAEEDL